ncbi:heparinase II/III domain-containing protein [Anatilimnocola aggregata]|nr:heparinase II/III family protein [Anatilimnocola aggregata]
MMIIVWFATGMVRADTRVSEDYKARTWQKLADGGLEYRFSFKLQGDSESHTRVIAQTGPTEHFKINVSPPADVPANKEVAFEVIATLDATSAKNLPPFTLDQCELTFFSQEKRLRELKRGTFVLRLATPAELTPPGEEFVKTIRHKVATEEWAQRKFRAITKSMDEKLKELGSPILPPAEGQWIKGDFHVWHSPKKVKLIQGENGVVTCQECERSWTPEQIKMGSERVGLFRATLAELGMAAMVSGDQRYGQAARQMLLGMADVYPNLPQCKYGTRLIWLVGDEARFSLEGLLCIRRLRAANMLSDEDLKTIGAGWIIPSLEEAMQRGSGTPNLAMATACAVSMAGLALDWPPFVAWSLRDRRGIMNIVEKRIGDDGGWLENSLSYHITTEIFFTPMLAELKLYGFDLLQIDEALGERLRRFYRFPILAMRPDEKLVSIADGGLGNPYPASNIAAYWVTRDPHLIPFIKGKDLEFGVTDLPPAQKVEMKSRNYPDFGITILHDGGPPGEENWALIRHGKQHGGHCHYDMLGMVSYAGGQPLHDDCGSSYRNPLHYSWARNTISHNTITVDKACQQKSEGKVEYLSTPAKGPQVVVISDESAYPGVRLERALIFVEGIQLLVDRATSDTEHTYDWTFACYGDVRGTSAESKAIPPLEGTALSESVYQNSDVSPTPPGVGYDVPRNLKEMNVSGDWWIDWGNIQAPYKSILKSPPLSMKWLCHSSNPVRVVWGDAPGVGLVPDRQRWVMARQVGNEALWVTALIPESRPAKVEGMKVVPATVGRGIAIQLKSASSETWVGVNWQAGKPLTAGPVSTVDKVVVQPSHSRKTISGSPGSP